LGRKEEFKNNNLRTELFGNRLLRTFLAAANKLLEENLHLARIDDYAMHLRQLDPYIGDLALEQVHAGTLQPFITARMAAGRKSKSINLALRRGTDGVEPRCEAMPRRTRSDLGQYRTADPNGAFGYLVITVDPV
jgi:hypothetical protein